MLPMSIVLTLLDLNRSFQESNTIVHFSLYDVCSTLEDSYTILASYLLHPSNPQDSKKAERQVMHACKQVYV